MAIRVVYINQAQETSERAKRDSRRRRRVAVWQGEWPSGQMPHSSNTPPQLDEGEDNDKCRIILSRN